MRFVIPCLNNTTTVKAFKPFIAKTNTVTCCYFFALFSFLFFLPQNSAASIEEAKLHNGLIATAEYRAGRPNMPALLILHGFLSTRNFLTVTNLVDALASDDYTVLAPNLTLGVSRRKKSLACEAVHTHSLEQDIDEIDYWVNWLVRHGHQKIVIIGHSYGSLHGLLYSVKHPSPHVTKLIAASLVDVEHVVGKEKSAAQISRAKRMLKNKDYTLQEFQVSYCKKYITPPDAFLSYATWSQQNILHAISKLQTPLEIILGSSDKRMGENWPNTLKRNGVKLQLIEGANHFFNNEQEFDLLESVQNALRIN